MPRAGWETCAYFANTWNGKPEAEIAFEVSARSNTKGEREREDCPSLSEDTEQSRNSPMLPAPEKRSYIHKPIYQPLTSQNGPLWIVSTVEQEPASVFVFLYRAMVLWCYNNKTTTVRKGATGQIPEGRRISGHGPGAATLETCGRTIRSKSWRPLEEGGWLTQKQVIHCAQGVK